jgi:DNA-binding transcriptional regulator WhiA
MLVASELKGELARIQPARSCCRRAELAGLLFAEAGAEPSNAAAIRTLEHPIARVAVQLASAVGVPAKGPMPASGAGPLQRPAGRHHLQVVLDRSAVQGWRWEAARTCDRRAFMRGALLSASISLGPAGAHVEYVFRRSGQARTLKSRLGQVGVRAAIMGRRGRSVVYVKGQEEVATLLRLTGANRALLDFEAGRVARDVRNRLNRLLNAEEANVDRTVRAADRQLQAISQLDEAGQLDRLPEALRETAALRRRQPDADLDTLASALGVSRSAMNHRLRRLVTLAAELHGEPD